VRAVEEAQRGEHVPQLLVEAHRHRGVQPHAGVQAGGAGAQRGGVGVAAGDLVGEHEFGEARVRQVLLPARVIRSGRVPSSLPSFSLRSTCLRSAEMGSASTGVRAARRVAITAPPQRLRRRREVARGVTPGHGRGREG
jgi:hypothetical protein